MGHKFGNMHHPANKIKYKKKKKSKVIPIHLDRP
jgi:hypothetical protein